MSEPIKKVKKAPESFSPKKKPEIINLIGQKTSNIVKTENGCYIDGIPPLGWDIPWRNCTYSGCMMLFLNALGTNTTYEQVMGFTGSCYRASMAYGWDAASSIVDIAYCLLGMDAGNNINRIFGIGSYAIENHDERNEQAQKSIDSGIPVLSLGSRGAPEWGIILGYEKTEEGVKYFGRSYFDGNAPENEIFTENRYVLGNIFADHHQFYNKPCESISLLDALKISLETCLVMFTPHEKLGYGAYDRIIKSFNDNDFKNDWGGDGISDWSGGMYNIFINFADARRAAHIYLTESADLLSDSGRNELLAVAAIYKDMFDILNGVMSEDDFDGNIIATSAITRNKIVEKIRECKALEYKAHDIVKRILDNWEDLK